MTVPSSPHDPSQHNPSQHNPLLEQALAKSKRQQKRLNQITFFVAVVMAIFISLIAANQNLYSMAATFAAALVFLLAASVYHRSLIVLIPFILLYCLADNFLSHDMQFHQSRFTLQFAALLIFTTIFYLSRPYLQNVLRALGKET